MNILFPRRPIVRNVKTYPIIDWNWLATRDSHYAMVFYEWVITTLRCHRFPRVRLANPRARWQIRCHLRADAQPQFRRNHPGYFFGSGDAA